MREKSKTAILLVALIAVGILAAPTAMAQNAAPPSLKDQLEAQYRLAKIAFNSGQLTVTEPGTVLVIQQAGIQGVPPGSLAMAPAICKDGVLHPPSRGSGFGASLIRGMSKPSSQESGVSDTRALPAGEKVYVSKLDVNLKKDSIGFRVIECDACNGVSQPSSYQGQVLFQFAKGSLATASVPDVEDTIAKVFAIDTGTAEAQPAQAGAQQPETGAAQPAPAQAPPAQIQLGQTIDQVVAAFGQPERTANVGSKLIYVYKDLKVTFVNGKVSDVQ